MYDNLWQIITSGDYTLTDVVYKINVFWAEGQLSDEERSELKEMALANISADQEKPELETMVESLATRVTALEEAVAALQSGDTSGTGSSTSYPEWTTWDGISTNYQYGDIVSHNGTLWIDTYEEGQNVWEPGALGTESLWTEYTETKESEE